MGFGGSGGGSASLSGSTDVALNTPANNQVLTYDSSTSKWKNAASAGGSGGSDLTVLNQTEPVPNGTPAGLIVRIPEG